ncbi:MAG: PSD1 and planctomycete cytochrome C domain-containing protein [Planctomycetota bacterium]
MIRPFATLGLFKRGTVILGLAWGLCVTADVPAADSNDADTVDFATEIRPILADACFQCHGPDEESRAADLRLDVEEDAAWVLKPGDSGASELIARVLETDTELVMPPPETGKTLTKKQIDQLRKWIDQGAGYEAHWAFETPVRPSIPATSQDDWVINPIDAYVARKLDANGLSPSSRASAPALIRRLYLDLIGLPPTPRELQVHVEAIASGDEAAYQTLVQSLLDSQHYGERWGRVWLDAARYADSDGYEKDKPRTAWFYRDWVIESLNEDRPYDDFLIRQIAGDLLPDATQDDHVATGFLRNSMVNEEGGADPEQFRMEAMFDRMDAIGKAVLGITVQCAQCHTHKYDPLQHEEYYGMMACLNNTHDAIISVYDDAEQAQRERSLESIEYLESELKSLVPDWKTRVEAWAEQQAARTRPRWKPLELNFLDRSLGGSKFLPQEDGSFLCQGYAPTNFKPQGTTDFHGKRLTGIRLELLRHPNLPRSGPGRSVDGTWALSELSASIQLSGEPGKTIPIKFVRAFADRSPEPAPLKSRYDNRKKSKRVTGGVEFAIDGNEKTAWTNEVDSPLANTDQVAFFEFEEPIEIPDGQYAIVTVFLAQRHGGWNSDDNQTFNIGRFRVSVTGDPLPSEAPLPIAVRDALRRPFGEWTEGDQRTVFTHWREGLNAETSTIDEPTLAQVARINRAIAGAWAAHPLGSTQLTLQQRDSARQTFLLNRGDFLSPEHEVTPHVPAFLHAFPDSGEPARLRLARWLASEQSPTTARSIVNRIWQSYFGTGLVETSDDLGTQSTPPSHRQLLDYLAIELMENNWSLKHLHRLIVSSATYRQSSAVTPELLGQDPYNRLLARGARFRVPAETVRDLTLAASGLLSREIGGPSVYPPAPAFLFKPPVSYGPKVWDEDKDEQRYRRALYTFRFRSVPYPMLENFDAVPGNLSCVRRSRSNTPMQALTALNEPLFLECSIAMANRLLEASPANRRDADRLQDAFVRCVARKPTEKEAGILLDYLNDQKTRLGNGELDADEILVAGSQLDLGPFDRNSLAAWSLVCRVILNLDETITRQ